MSNEYHDIDKLFQKNFENYESAPPFNMWNKIEGNLPLTETDRLFKNAFENYEREPSPEVWERIKPALPLSLTLRTAFVHLSRIAAVLLIGITLYVFAKEFDWSKKDEIAQQQNQQEQFISPNQYYNESDVLADEEILGEPIAMLEDKQNNNANAPTEPRQIVNEHNSPFNNSENTAKGGDVVIHSKGLAKTAILNIGEIEKRLKNGDNSRIPSGQLFQLNFIEEESSKKDSSFIKEIEELKSIKNKKMEDVTAIASVDFDGKIRRPASTKAPIASSNSMLYLSLQGRPDKSFGNNNGFRIKRSTLEQEAFNFKGLYLSGHAAFGTSSILNDAMKDQIGTSMNAKYLTKASNFGVGVGYQFTTKWAVETGLSYVNQNQSYNDATVSLNYYAIPLTLKYRSNEISGAKPAAISYVFGVQAASLESGQRGNLAAIQNEIGMTAGVDYDLYLNPNVSFTIGARANVGTDVNNAFENYNTFVGIRSAVNFRFSK